MNEIIKNAILATTHIIPDELYLRIAYRIVTGKTLHLNPPVTFNEKLQWLKLHYRQPLLTQMVDKYGVRDFIKERIGEEYLIPVYGVWDKPESVDFSILPERFVLKCTHDCGGVIICQDKTKFNEDDAIKRLIGCMQKNFYYQGREWPYKNVVPRVYAETYLEDSGDSQLTDYKVFNFNGIPRIIQVDFDRYTDHKRKFFDTEWNEMDVTFHQPYKSEKIIKKPACMEEMLDLARKLSSGFPHLRTDFYIVNDRLYVGEMTFFHGTGFGKWTPESFDAEMGSWLDLSSVK